MRYTALVSLAVSTLLSPSLARAHCDTLDGPVVGAARAALETGQLNATLAWVQPAQEAEVRDAFAKARAARKAGKEARDVADTWFFETIVRVHRAGEGAPYTGLKAAGEPIEPAVAAVDRAIAAKDPKAVEALLVGAVRDGLHARWAKLAAEQRPGADLTAGRRWVAAYVPFVHWAEGVQAAAEPAGAHGVAAGHEEAGHPAQRPAEDHAGHRTGAVANEHAH